MQCHVVTCFKGRWRVKTTTVLDTLEWHGEAFALVKASTGYEVICTKNGAWVLKLADRDGWQAKTLALLDGKGQEAVAAAAIEWVAMNYRFGLEVKPGVWNV